MKENLAFSPDHILPALKTTTAFAVIDEMLDHLVQIERVPMRHRNAIGIEIKNRERTMSTGIGFGIAVPHGYSETFDDFIVVFGRSAQGIDFSALDGLPVKFVTLIVIPVHRRQQYLRLLNCIARTLHQRDIRQQLECVMDAEAIVRILNGRSFGINI